MWLFEQSTGKLFHDNRIFHGYSGHGTGKNNPAQEAAHNVGPIPCGLYRIGDPYFSADKGPLTFALRPDPANTMHGRGGFLIHGDSKEHPGEASEGCIVMDRTTRETIAQTIKQNPEDRLLEVLAVIGVA